LLRAIERIPPALEPPSQEPSESPEPRSSEASPPPPEERRRREEAERELVELRRGREGTREARQSTETLIQYPEGKRYGWMPKALRRPQSVRTAKLRGAGGVGYSEVEPRAGGDQDAEERS
jgi:hypothetical protein